MHCGCGSPVCTHTSNNFSGNSSMQERGVTEETKEMGDFSDGSDIDDADYSSEDENGIDLNYERSPEPLLKAQWMFYLFQNDDDNDLPEGAFPGFQATWKTPRYHRRRKKDFTRKPGLKIDLPEDATPFQMFSKLFTEELFMHLVTETNRYAQQCHGDEPPGGRTKSNRWTPVTLTKMKIFIGMCIAMGNMKLPVRSDYWRQKRWLFQTSLPQAMSRDRFDMIWS